MSGEFDPHVNHRMAFTFSINNDRHLTSKPKEDHMLWTIAVILIIMWALGLVSSYTMGGFIHILLVIAIIVVLLNVIQGRRG